MEPSVRSHAGLVTAVLCALTFSACGGGGGGGSTGEPQGNGGSRGVATLEWTPPTQRANGSILPPVEIGGYRVYVGESPDDMWPVAELPGVGNTSYTFHAPGQTTYYFSVTTFDWSGLESANSEVRSKSF